jgi:hypothetical protein
MDFTNSTFFSSAVNGVADGIFAVVVVGKVVVLTLARGTTLNGMTSMGIDCSFSFNNCSNFASISFIFAFCSMISFNSSSFSSSVSAIYLARESSVGGNFSFFLRDAMLALFFFNISSASFTIEGSYPILSTNSSKDFILLSRDDFKDGNLF